MKSKEVRERAVELRVVERKSVKEIATELQVAQSTVSVWLRSSPLTEEERKAKSKVRRKRERETFNAAGEKWCPQCESWLSVQSFWKHASTATGLRAFCSACERNKKMGWKGSRGGVPGVTQDLLQQMLKQQGGVCGICKRAFQSPYHIDHDHSTGEIRGLLCGGCNLGLGCFQDNAESLLCAAEYLRNHGVIR